MGWTKIWDYSSEPGKMSIAVLGDRAIITDGQADPPLVFSGCMQNTQVDWAYPKNVISTQDGARFYDVSPYVLDQDTDVAADIGGIRENGYIAVCTDLPKVDAFYVEMGTANTGLTVSDSLLTETLDFDVDTYDIEDIKGSISYWYQDSGATGHFEGEAKTLSGAVVDNGDGTVNITCTGHGLVTNDYARIYGTTNYNNTRIQVTRVDDDTIKITETYVAETVSGSLRKRLGFPTDGDMIEEGVYVFVGSTDAAIENITNTGEDSGEITLSEEVVSGSVTKVNGLHNKGSAVSTTTNEYDSGVSFSGTSVYSGVWSGEYVSMRQLISASQISYSGDYLQITIQSAKLSTSLSAVTSYGTPGLKVIGCSIGEASSGGSATSLTPITFNNGSAGFTIGCDERIVSDVITFAVDETKNYIIVVDVQPAIPAPWYGSQYTNMSGYYQWYYSQMMNGFITPNPNVSGYSWIKKDTTSSSTASIAGQTGWSVYYSIYGIVKFETFSYKVASANTQIISTNDNNQVDISYIETFGSMTITDSTPGSASIFFAVSFDDRTIWKVFVGTPSVWREIARNNSGTWEYKDAVDAWVSASTNTQSYALREAFAIAENQWDSTAINAMVSSDWTDTDGILIKTTQTIDVACGLTADGYDNIPYIDTVAFSFIDQGQTVIEGLYNGAWSERSGWTDNTVIGDIPLAQSGIISYDGATPYETEYGLLDGIPGYWFRFKTNGTSAGTTITRILYSAPTQELKAIGDGYPEVPTGFVYVDTSSAAINDLTDLVGDSTLTSFSKADVPMAADDYLYIGYPLQFAEIEIVPYNNNTSTSTLSAEYWNGNEWSDLTISDNTSSSSKTFAQVGKVRFALPTNWRQCIPFDSFFSRSYWIRLSVSVALSTTTSISECRIYPIPDDLRKYKYAEVFENRLALACRPDQLSQVDISRPFEPWGLAGSNSGSFPVGGAGSIVSMVSAWNGLFIGKPEVWNQMKADGQGSYKFEAVEAARAAPLSNQVIVKAPTQGFEAGDKYGLFFLNRYGAFVNTGMHTDSIFDTQKARVISTPVNWWSGRTSDTPRLDLDNLHIAVAAYWPVRNWVMWSVPMILSGSTPQTTNNRVIVYDLNIQNWLPPFSITAASLCTAYHYDSTAPGKLGQLGLYAGTYSGTVVRLFEPEVYTESGSNVAAYLETGWLHFGEPESEKELREFWVFGQTVGTNITLTVYTRSWVKTGQVSDTVTKTYTDLTNAGDICGMAFEGGEAAIGNFIKIRLDWSGKTDILGISLGILGLRNYPAT